MGLGILKLAYNALFKLVYLILQRLSPNQFFLDGVRVYLLDKSVFNPKLYVTSKLLTDEAPVGSGLALDYGCGSGYTSVKLALKKWFVIATDLNEKACESAWATALANRVSERVCVVRCCGASVFRDGVFNLVVSNPPYMWGRVAGLMDYGVVDENARFLVKLVSESKFKLSSSGVLVIVYSTISPYWRVLLKLLFKAGFKPRVSRVFWSVTEYLFVTIASRLDRGGARAPQPFF